MDTVFACGECGKEFLNPGLAAWCCARLVSIKNGTATYEHRTVIKNPLEYVEIKISTDEIEVNQ